MGLFGKKESVRLKITGMTCGSCQKHVREALQAVPGVSAAQVDLAFHKADVTYDPEKARVDDLVRAVEAAGYEAQPQGAQPG